MKFKEYEQPIKSYHDFHGDKNVKIIKSLRKAGYSGTVLVRLTGEDGRRYSCIDVVYGNDDVSEIDYSLRENEKEMLDRFLNDDDEDEY